MSQHSFPAAWQTPSRRLAERACRPVGCSRRPVGWSRRITAALLSLLLVCGLPLAGVLSPPAPAQAAAKVSVSGTPNPDGTSTLKLSGRGFQSVQNGFGGIYVLFGVVNGTWQPSKGGRTGVNLRYAYDNESKPEGFQLFVTFPGSTTAYAANGGQLRADGTWNGTIKVPGAKFTSYDRQRKPINVDCTKEQCGIITIGAHGVKNANNETFTPVNFAAGGGGAAGGGKDAKAAAPAAEAQQAAPGQPAAPQPGAPAADQPGGTSGGPVTGPIQPVIQPIVGPEQVDQLASNTNQLILILLAGIVVTASLIALAVGVGSYLAAKSLLLGVNPEALERVRARRAKRAIAAEHKRQRKVFDYRAKQEARTRKRQQLAEAKAARADIDRSAQLGTPSSATPSPGVGPDAAPGTAAASGAAPASELQTGPGAEPASVDPPAAAGPMRFFDIISQGTSSAEPPAGNQQPASAPAAGDAPTLVLDRPTSTDSSPTEPQPGREEGNH